MNDDLDLYFDPDEVEQPFVGRATFLKSLRDTWLRNRVFGIFGQKSVGKSRTVKEFLKRLKTDLGDDCHLKVIPVDLQEVTSMQTVVFKMLDSLGFNDEIGIDADDWLMQMCNKLDSDISHAYILSFDNAEDCLNSAIKDVFTAACSTVIWTCHNVRIILSSTTKLTRGFPFFIWQELPPMDTADGSELVKSIAPEVNFGEHLGKIVELCCGLPLALNIVAFELSQQGPSAITPESMVETLSQCRLRALSDERYASVEQVGTVYCNFIGQLTREFQQRLAILGCIPGSFRAVEACQLLDETGQHTLRSLLRCNMIQFEARTRRYNMHGILRDCLEVYYKIDNIPEIRKRYCRTFGQVIRELSSRMETSEYVEAYADINQEHPNLRKMLTDVMHSEQESFPFYVEMATSSASLIIAFFGNESIQFFTKCFELAELYGKQRDRALVMTHYGRALTNVKSDFVEGRRMLTMAMDIMEQSPPSESLAAILLSLGWTVYLQGDIPEAAKHFSRGLEVTQETGCENSLIKCKFLNCLGLANNAEGNQEAAEKYMFGALRSFIKKLGNEHPCVGSVYNNIGLLMKSKHDHDKAKEYFELGLQIKQKMKAPLTATIVSQNNVAYSYITLERYFEAKILLESALASLEYTPGLYSFERGLILYTFGKMYLKQENYQDAIATLQKAVDIRRTYNEGSVNHIESLIHLGKAYKGAGAEDEALKSFEEAVFYESKVYKWKIDALRMDSCYLEMIDILTNLSDVIRVKAVYEKATAHLTAMIKMHQTKPRPHLVEQYEKQLADLQESQRANSLLCKLESCNT